MLKGLGKYSLIASPHNYSSCFSNKQYTCHTSSTSSVLIPKSVIAIQFKYPMAIELQGIPVIGKLIDEEK